MAKIDLISNEWSELVFQGRNQAYGAYQLRRGASKRHVFGILFVFLMAVVAYFGLAAYTSYQEAQKAKLDAERKAAQLRAEEEAAKEAEPEKEVEVQYEEAKPVEQLENSIKFTAPVIKDDNEVKEENQINLKEVEESKENVAAFTVTDGTSDGTGKIKEAAEEIAGPAPAPEPKHEAEKPFDIVEQMPQFPGGQAELMKYISSHIKYPPVAEENGIQGKVIVKFVVGADGSVKNVKIAKGVDPSLDKEAARVIGNMPKWIPGKQNGQAVSVNYTVPVIFKLQ